MLIKKIACAAFVMSSIFLCSFGKPVLAEVIPNTAKYEIVKIEELSAEDSAICLVDETLPKPEELTKVMPDYLSAYTEDNGHVNIPVEWHCDEKDYYDDTMYRVNFEPEFDTSVYSVKADCKLPKFYVDISIREQYKVSAFNLSGEANEDTCYNFLRDTVGINCAAACGVLGNMYVESWHKFDPLSYNSKENAWGICQWRNDRLNNLKSRYPNSWKTLDSQLHFLVDELNGLDYAGKKTLSYLKGRADDVNGADEAALYFAKEFERCDSASYDERRSWAKSSFNDRKEAKPIPIHIVDSRFADFVPFQSYALGTWNISVYDEYEKQYSNRYISGSSDECTINEVYTDGWCKVTYPSSSESSGYFTAYTHLDEFIPNLSTSEWTVNSESTAFRRSTGRDTIGSVPRGTKCLRFSSSDKRMQLIYWSDGSHKMGWISEYADLWEDFYASIYLKVNGNVVSNDFVNVSGRQYNGNDSQKWHFYRCDGENGYTLRNMADYKMLTAGDSAYVSDENGQDNQIWYIGRNDDGSFSLISKANEGIALDLGGASNEEGANILTIEAHSEWDSQKWMIQKYNSYGGETNLGDHFYARIQNNKSQTFLTSVDGDVQGYHDLQNNSQVWEFTRNGNGSYRIQSVTTGDYMQIDWVPDKDGTNIICKGDTNNAKRDWFIYQVDGGYSLYPSASHTQALELSGCNAEDGAIVQTWTLHRDWESQIFNITKGFVMLDADSNPGKTISESVYRIKSSVDENFEVNISGNGNETGTNVQVWSKESNNPYFQFAFVYMDDGYYMIISEGSGLALEVSGSGEGANIQQGKITGESNQMFRVHSAGENYYYLVPKSDSAMCVDLQGANAENGTNVEIWTSLQNRAQIWKLEKHDEKCKPVLWTDLSAVKENETVTVNYAGVSDYSQVMLHVLKDGKEESSKDVTGTKEYKLSFEKEGTYELYVSGSSNGQWYDSRHTKIEVTVDKPSVVMEVKGSVLTATITKPEKVKYQGIVYGTTKDVSLDTKGRTRVVFTKIAADGTISLDASALKGKNYYFRAYIIYENANGNEVKEYSDAVTLSNTK